MMFEKELLLPDAHKTLGSEIASFTVRMGAFLKLCDCLHSESAGFLKEVMGFIIIGCKMQYYIIKNNRELS